MNNIRLILTLLIFVPIVGFSQGYNVESIQTINNTSGGLAGSVLDASDYFGMGVEVIGDVDHDGVDDIAVGAYMDDDGGTDRGAVYILLLNSDGTVKGQHKISELSGDIAFPSDSTYFGYSIAALGDLNGDGNVDIAVGAPHYYNLSVSKYTGVVYVLFLDDDGSVLEYGMISEKGPGNWNFGGGPDLDDQDGFGASVNNIGDLNKDGIPDLAIHASGDDDGGTDYGATYIAFLDYNGSARNVQKISALSGSFGGTLSATSYFGDAVSVGDINGDGIIDLAIGSKYDDDGGTDRGAVWICFMNEDGTVDSEQKISDTQGGFTGVLDDSDFFGSGLVDVGDLDGDGIQELAVGAERDDDSGSDKGALWILYLNSDGTVRTFDKIGNDTILNVGVGTSDYLFTDISFFGDRNNDGKIDLLVGAWNASDGNSINSGEVRVLHLDGIASYPQKKYYNAPGFVLAVKKLSDLSGEPLENELDGFDSFGYSSCNIGDLDG
ncbi:MAG: FG-GAP repeat protein, partial [Flavobacteriales bacterium]|nr:FG-GAP repeat protein [Flavobacteriales bacterium]